MRQETNTSKIVVFSGAGISAESGLSTFRDKDGLWRGIDPMSVASSRAWEANPRMVLEFYKERISKVADAQPNAAHLALRELESQFEVVVITQNIDDLHERAGSTKVIHLHGSIVEARADGAPETVYHRGYMPIEIGDVDSGGRQLRPNIVLFGEMIMHHDLACSHLATADRVLVVGTSLTVYPAAGLLDVARADAEKVIVAYEIVSEPDGYQFHRGSATDLVPKIVSRWCQPGATRE